MWYELRPSMNTLMKTAFIFAEASHCKRNQVGAVISVDRRIISTGYNGMPTGFTNECEDGDTTKSIVIHAEANAILFAAKNGVSLKGSKLTLTLSPCIECAKMIIQSGISHVEYHDEYRVTDGIELLEKAGVKIWSSKS